MSTSNGHSASAHGTPGAQTPARSLVENIFTASFLALIPTTLAWFFLRDAAWWVWSSASLIVFGPTAAYLVQMSEDVLIQPRYTGVGQILEQPVPTLYTSGTHKRIRGIEGLIPVYTAPMQFDPPAIVELTAEQVSVEIDGFFFAQITDPYLWVQAGGHDKEKALMDLFDTEVRLFVSPWLKASALIGMRDLLGDFLCLPTGSLSSPHALALRQKFDELADPNREGGQLLTLEKVKSIWEDAGKFRNQAAEWGYTIQEIHIEDLDLPDRIKAAAEERAAQSSRMDALRIEVDARKDMVNTLTTAGVSPDTANNTIDMMLKLPVTKGVEEIHIIGLTDLVKTMTTNPEAAAAFMAAFTRFSNTNRRRG